MGKTLVLAEKPSVGRDLAKVLNCNQKNNGYVSGQKYVVTWALGHLVTLADPEAYNKKYKSWDLEDLPMLPDKMELSVIKETSKQYGIVRNLLRQQDIDEIIIATDAGREGELVARWIIEKSGCRKPIKRLWISSQTDKAIKEGFSKLKPGKDFDNLYRAAQCRAEADWLIGLNVTRALTCKYNAQLSAGRVQTPTLALIVRRENEIKSFVPKDYWTVEAKTAGFTLLWKDKNGGTRLFDKSKAEAIVSKLSGQTGEITDIKKEAKSEPHPLAYDLTELQRDANKKYGYSAKQTLSIMQSLYERHKVLTYPRTDSRHITADIVPTLQDRLKSIATGPYAGMAQKLLRGKINTTGRLVDNSKVSDHHAIIPTEQPVRLSALSAEERNIFDLVAKRFIAVLSPAYRYEQITVKVEALGEQLFARGKTTKDLGWKAVYDNRDNSDTDNADEEDKEQLLPLMQKGDKLKLLSVKSNNRKTKPPARYTEATLLTAMEFPGKYIENEDLKEALEKASGLGTPATRADIIEKLFNTYYIEKKGKEIYPTAKGMQLIDLAPNDLRSAELTAKWEQQLDDISKGKANANSFIKDIRNQAGKLVSSVIASTEEYRHDNMTRTRCPDCGKYLLEVNGRKGRMLICPDRECGYRKGLAQLSNAQCPECRRRMELKGEGEGRLFTCSCGYREKLSSFNKRMDERIESSDKRTVQRYMQQQKKEEPINTSMADALAKWKAMREK